MAAKSNGGGSGNPLKNFFLGLVVGVVLTGATGWYLAFARKDPRVIQAQDAVASGITHAVDLVEARIDAFQLSGKDVKEDMLQTGQVVRRSVRAVGTAVADATDDPRITATIKAKLLANRELSAWDISVSTTDGVVTLSGTVASHDQIGRAMLVALETPGVREVMSTLRVKTS
jgi:hypothetical protein